MFPMLAVCTGYCRSGGFGIITVAVVGVNTADIDVHLPYEPIGVRPLLGEPANPNLSADQQAVRPLMLDCGS